MGGPFPARLLGRDFHYPTSGLRSEEHTSELQSHSLHDALPISAVSMGIGLGAFVAGRLSGDQVELGLVPIGSVGLGVFGIFLFFAHHTFAEAWAGHFLLGFSGGIFIIPLQA